MKRLALVLAACGHPAASSHDAAPAVRKADAGVRTPDAAATPPDAASPRAADIPIPGGEHGIAFDDLQYADGLIIPAGRTIELYDPDTGEPYTIAGFHKGGATSAVWGVNGVYAIDRQAKELDVTSLVGIDTRTPLAGSPGYVRVIGNREIWVTEPDKEQIEVFVGSPPKPFATIPVPGGPESLVESRLRHTAYANLWKGQTVAIDVAQKKLVATWSNGCTDSRGLELNEHGWLFVGCAEGKVTALDVDHGGKLLGSAPTGAGVDNIAYARPLHRLYAPGADAATTTVIAVGDDGSLEPIGTVPAAKGSHCAVTDEHGRVWVCDPAHGKLLGFTDSF